MQTIRIVQAVVLMTIVVMATSCAASKEYSSKLFAPRVPVEKDSLVVVKTLRFLEIDDADINKEDWVSTDIIMGRDTVNTVALDKFATSYPAVAIAKDTTTKTNRGKTTTVIAEAKPVPAASEPVAKNANPGEVRTKKTRE